MALQRSCALQLLQSVDSTIGLAMLPRRFDCFKGTRVAHALDDLSTASRPPASARSSLSLGKALVRPSKTHLIPVGLLAGLSEPAPGDRSCASHLEASAWFNKLPVELKFTSLLLDCLSGAIDRCASERLRRSSPLHLSNI